MSYTEYIYETPGLTLYAKSLPLNTDSWTTGTVEFVPLGTTGQYSAILETDSRYFVYSQAGENPASTDLFLGWINPVNLSNNIIESITNSVSAKISLSIGTVSSNETLSTNLEVFQGEQIQQTIVALLSDLTTPIDLSGLTLELVFETKNRDLISVISSANITISGDNNNLVTFTYPDVVTSTTGIRYWTLRDTDNASKVRLNGTLNVVRASINTSV